MHYISPTVSLMWVIVSWRVTVLRKKLKIDHFWNNALIERFQKYPLITYSFWKYFGSTCLLNPLSLELWWPDVHEPTNIWHQNYFVGLFGELLHKGKVSVLIWAWFETLLRKPKNLQDFSKMAKTVMKKTLQISWFP
jgi:hypothetical protein